MSNSKSLREMVIGLPTVTLGSKTWKIRSHAGLMGETILRLHWDSIITPSSADRKESSRLLVRAKRFFAWFLATHARKTEIFSTPTIRNYFTDLRVLVTWMTTEGLYDFRDLTTDRVIAFLQYRNSTQFGDKPLAKRTVRARRFLIVLLHKYHLDAGDGVTFDADLQIDLEIVEKLSEDGRWNPVPENIAIPLLRDCVEWISGPAIEFIEVIEECQRQKECSIGRSKSARKKGDSAIFNLVCTGERFGRFAAYLNLPTTTTPGQLLRLGRKETIASCCFLILYFTGMRVSELLALRQGCVQWLPHEDGNKFPYITGVITKKGVRQHRWVAIDLVVNAIQLLERINRPILSTNGDSRLFASSPTTAILAHTGLRFGQKKVRDINDLLKVYAKADRRTQPIPSTFRIHSHQGRETFASFVGFRDKSSLDALASHFAHAHKRITDRGYLGNDIDLNRLLDLRDRQDLANALEDILTSERLAGAAGEYIEKKSKLKLRFRGKKELQATVERLIKEGVRLAPCNWGYCVYREELSACRGDRQGPNEVRRTASTCSGCQNFCATAKHAPWWDERMKRNEELLMCKDIPEMTRALAIGRVRECRKILDSISIGMEKGLENEGD